VDLFQIGCEGHHQAHFFAELVHRQSVLRPYNRVHKLARRDQLERQIFPCAQARIHGQYNRERQRRFPAEDRDLLLFAIFFQYKIFFLQVRHRSSVPVRHRHKHVDQLHVDLDRGFRLLRHQPGAGAKEQGAKEQDANDEASHVLRATCYEPRASPYTVCSKLVVRSSQLALDSLHLRVSHLDASCSTAVSQGRRISAGNASPSAHTAPSSKYSFFQMGTVFLSVSMIHRQASKAASRCAAATTISTLVSPISSRPKRWTIDAARTAKRARASAARDSICFRAIAS